MNQEKKYCSSHLWKKIQITSHQRSWTRFEEVFTHFKILRTFLWRFYRLSINLNDDFHYFPQAKLNDMTKLTCWLFRSAFQQHLNFAFCCNILTKEKKTSFENDSIENCAFIEVRRFFIENTKWKTSMTLRGFARWCGAIDCVSPSSWYNLKWFLCNFRDFLVSPLRAAIYKIWLISEACTRPWARTWNAEFVP